MCSGLTAFAALKRIAEHAKRGPVLLVGLGGVGMMGLAFALALFPHKPIVADIDPAKREAALKAGAAAAYDPADPAARKALLRATGGVAARSISPAPTARSRSRPARIAKGGKVVITGLIGGTFTTPIAMFPLKAMTIEGTMTGTLAEAQRDDGARARRENPAGADHRAPALRRAGLARRSARRQDRRPRRAGAVATAAIWRKLGQQLRDELVHVGALRALAPAVRQNLRATPRSCGRDRR